MQYGDLRAILVGATRSDATERYEIQLDDKAPLSAKFLLQVAAPLRTLYWQRVDMLK